MIKLHDKSTGQYLGNITDDDLQFLIDNLEEESLTDTDYYLNRPTLDYLKSEGMSQGLAELLDRAMGEKTEVEIQYERVD
jgi:hypothetical protein